MGDQQPNDRDRNVVLLDDATGGTVTEFGETRAANPGEHYAFERLAEALRLKMGVPVTVGGSLPDTLKPGTVFIIPAYQLERWRTELAGRSARFAIVAVDAARESIARLVKQDSVIAAIEHHQYWAWRTGERADASIFGDLRVVPSLHYAATVTPLDDGHFGRIRISGEDLPGLLGDYLMAMMGGSG